ncbi:EGF-like domain-containing protein, partial [Haematococcus lacustris]
MNTQECRPKEGADGTKYNAGGWRSWADIYGPGGWCVAEQPVATCPCSWYGHDCSRKVAGQALEPSRIPQRRWLQGVAVEPPAAQEPPPAATRKRPLIF